MRLRPGSFTLFAVLVVFVTGGRSQDAVYRLWPDGAPGAIDAPDYREGQTFWNGDKTWPLATGVKDAAVEVYRPAANNSGTAILIFPGGGYTTLNIEKEGRAVARWLTTQGMTGLVVKYRLPNSRIIRDPSIGPLQDAQAALRFARRHAAEWKISPDRIGVMGFSAGGHVAALLSTLYSETTYTDKDGVSARPSFAILVYPLISMRPELTSQGLRHDLLGEKPSREVMDHYSAELHVTAETPPTFIAHAKDDQAVSFKQSERYAEALREKGVPVELHLYEKGNHGFALGATPEWPQAWPRDLQHWLVAQSFLGH